MHNPRPHDFIDWSGANAAFMRLLTLSIRIVIVVFFIVTTQPALAQFSVIANFNLTNGAYPTNLSLDRAGNLYGGTFNGGDMAGPCLSYGGCGTIFKMTNGGSNWTFRTMYDFPAGSRGAGPGPLAIGPDGTLYGTAQYGGSGWG